MFRDVYSKKISSFVSFCMVELIFWNSFVSNKYNSLKTKCVCALPERIGYGFRCIKQFIFCVWLYSYLLAKIIFNTLRVAF